MNKRSKIAILGFGVEGRSVLKYLRNLNYDDITVCDANVDLKDEMPDGVSVRLGPHYLENLMDFEVIFRSPGIRYLEPNIQAAILARAEVTSCTAFFLDQCPCPVIGVTGTKGKGTTSTLIYEILKNDGRDVYLGGNIGVPPTEFLDELKGSSVAVLEMSSFQLQDLTKSPHYAVLLNTTTDHLDYHEDRDEYLVAKESLLAHQEEESVAVMNHDYEYVKYYLPLVKGRKLMVSRKSSVHDGAFVSGDNIIFCDHGEEEKVANVSDVSLVGAHNLENVLPAVSIAKMLGVKNGVIVKSLKKFKGLPHRLEFSGEAHGVKYYNDSFSTTPETSMAAVDAFEEPTALIAGGYDKGLNYDEWAVKILTKETLKGVVLIGDTAKMMEDSIEKAKKTLGKGEASPTEILEAKTLEEAVDKASGIVKTGGIVVMSPASSSFDLYKDYKERGKKFMKIAAAL